MTGIADIHCHMIPGVDDGAADMETALQMLRMEYEQGVRRIIFTPHFRREYFETSRDMIKARFRELCEQVRMQGIGLELYLGCEFHRQSDMFELSDKERAYRMADSDYILMEFSGADTADTVKRYVTEALIHGVRPVIAHAERYPALRNVRLVRFLVDSGAYIQVNAGAILGNEGWSSRRFCKLLLREGLVHLIGSDAHDIKRRRPCMAQCVSYLERKFGADRAEQLMIDNPGRIIANEYI